MKKVQSKPKKLEQVKIEPVEVKPYVMKKSTTVVRPSVKRRPITTHLKQEIAKEFNYSCAYCGRKIEEVRNGEIDNFFPISQYPEKAFERSNLIYSCPFCNRIKGGKSPIKNGKKVILNPRENVFTDHIEERTGGILFGLTELGKDTIDFFSLNSREHIEQRVGRSIISLMNEEDYHSVEPIINNEVGAYERFLDSLSSNSALLNVNIEEENIKIHHLRLLYANVITVLESYLSDTFITNVVYNDAYLRKFVETFHDYNKTKFNFSEIFSRYESVETTVLKSLLDVLYHNLMKVKGMYKDTLGISFPKDIDTLLKAVDIRHDIVHRNGKDKDGVIHEINRTTVEDLISEVKMFAHFLEEQL